MKIKVTTETGFVNCVHVEYLEVPNDISEEELEAEAKEVAFDRISWCYEKIEGDKNES